MARKRTAPATFNTDGGLLSWEENGTNYCLGDLIHFSGHGVFDATYGRVNVTPEQAKTHNEVFDRMKLKGLDENCKVGQGGIFYYYPKTREVRTFLGTKVNTVPTTESGDKQITVTFCRNAMLFRGRVRKDDQSIFFKRVS